MSLKYLGVGLSRTGTKSLCKAMTKLKFRSRHWEPELLEHVVLGTLNHPNFRKYDDFDFVCDIPHAYFFREIEQAYPGLKFILTERDEDKWYESMDKHFRKDAARDALAKAIHLMVYGRDDFDNLRPFLYKKRFRDWNDTVKRVIPAEKLLVMDICCGKDGYAALCPFVGTAVLNEDFPHENKSSAG
jgi:hypothetical protein